MQRRPTRYVLVALAVLISISVLLAQSGSKSTGKKGVPLPVGPSTITMDQGVVIPADKNKHVPEAIKFHAVDKTYIVVFQKSEVLGADNQITIVVPGHDPTVPLGPLVHPDPHTPQTFHYYVLASPLCVPPLKDKKKTLTGDPNDIIVP